MSWDIVLRHANAVRHAALSMWRTARYVREVMPDPEDAVQAAVLYCAEKGLKHFEYGSVRTYLVFMARRGVCTAAQKHWHRHKAGLPTVTAGFSERSDDHGGVPSHERAVDARIDAAVYLGALPPFLLRAVTLRYGLDGHGARSEREVAECLGTTEACVNSYLSLARRKLRQKFPRST